MWETASCIDSPTPGGLFRKKKSRNGCSGFLLTPTSRFKKNLTPLFLSRWLLRFLLRGLLRFRRLLPFRPPAPRRPPAETARCRLRNCPSRNPFHPPLGESLGPAHKRAFWVAVLAGVISIFHPVREPLLPYSPCVVKHSALFRVRDSQKCGRR